MKHFTIVVASGIMFLSGCNDSEEISKGDEPEAKFQASLTEAEYSIAEYRAMQPSRPIIAIFGHKWEPPILETAIRHKEVLQRLGKYGFLCVKYDCTNTDSLGVSEMQRLEQISLPLAVLSFPNTGESYHSIEYNEKASMEFVELALVLAEQDAAPNR